ncbi:MAG: pyridoxal phosphate-dependent aminotransferase [Gammaproteobacteria bacterium]|nr:pyridoxal phosphate-dependent aminotransferase [Gammaproteobacteria bacterium]NNC97195.1 pyridoxal phosphate-dependent aminotransferase [Gammaproteobacteria bacterium]NNM14495.1 pyridoxal phosphate-dependent aminotransferase [Gammaproteobacteria bacterium]
MSQPHLSERVQRVQPSATLAIADKARRLSQAGQDIISLSTGEPDFDTPEHIKNAAIDAIHTGASKYTAVNGILELREAIVQKFKSDNGLSYEADDILVSSGAKHSLYNICQALLNSGDEVIIPAPYWVSYPAMVLLADATPVIVKTTQADEFKITPEQLAAAITDKTRLLILNSPSNPCAVSYSADELRALAVVLRQHPQVIIVSDDIYEHISWSEAAFSNIAMVAPDLKDRVIVVNGVSKAYAMTGWRIGYLAGSRPLVNAMKKIQSQSTSNPAAVAQYAALQALSGSQDPVREMVTHFKRRYELVYAGLKAMDGVDCLSTQGTFYAFPNVDGVIQKLGLKDDLELADHMLDKAGVAVVPGTAFGAPGHFRMSYATSDELLEKALDRMAKAFAA